MRFLVIILCLVCSLCCSAQINIWESTSCKKHVELTPYIAQNPNAPAVIVCPGGSYYWHDMQTEGHDVAKWLQANGISAFVLKYRTAKATAFIFGYRLIFRGNRYPDPQNDLRRTIQLLKERSEEFGIDTTKIGAMGFSAGGHLVMSAAELFADNDRPCFVAPIYPVVTLVEPCVHKRSRRGLLGDNRTRNKELREHLSLEKNVPDNCPPVFLVNCVDDPIVDYHNSELLDSALTARDVVHKYIQYRAGGHGFGASDTKGTAECREWRQEFIKWFDTYIR